MNQYKKYNILKAASWYTIGNILIKGVAFFILPVFTRLMNTHDYGVYSVYTSYLSIFEVVILLGLSSTVSIAKFAKDVKFESYISTIISLPVIFAIICAVGINLCLPVFGNILSMDATLWNCLIISAACGAINNIIGARLVIDGKYRVYMGYSGIYTIANIGISLLLCYTVFNSRDIYLARVFGSTLAAIISMVYLLILTKTWFRLDRENVKLAFVWGIPLLFHTLATVVLTQSDRILIRYMDSYSSAGIYAVATTIVSIPMVLQSSFQQAWTPWFYGKLDEKAYGSLVWLNNRYIVGYGMIIVMFMLVSPEIIHLFTSESYWNSLYSLLPLAISIFGEMLYSIPTSVEYYNKKTTYIMTATVITVLINIVLDVAFIMLFGYVGAAYATAVSKLLLFLMHYFFSRRIDRNPVFSNYVVILSLIVLIGINVLVTLLGHLWGLRYLMLFCIVFAGVVYVYKIKDKLISYM